jgi:hypothetical protein
MRTMRELFHHQGVDGEVISLRQSLANHFKGEGLSLRQAESRFLKPADGDGFAQGCRRPDVIAIDFGLDRKPLGGALPSWVPVNRRDHREGSGTRTVEGILTVSKITHEDFPFKPWHTYYDWNFFVRVDPQYRYLLSDANPGDGDNDPRIMECEWDTAFLPSYAWPQEGDRVWLVGRWIYDCGHLRPKGHRTEIHPPKAVASFRSEPVQFQGNRGPTRANNAVVYIGRNGGYWRHPINDQDYAFNLYLPPRPYAEAVPRFKVVSKTGDLPVEPRVTPYPARDPKLLRVVIPLRGVTPHPDEYGAVISGGWSDPRGTESDEIRRLRVTVETVFMDANLDPRSPVDFSGRDDWHVYVGVNGRWKIFETLSGDSETLDYTVDLQLHPRDRIHITACGFEDDEIHELMGKNIGLSWEDVENHDQMRHNAERIRAGFLSLGLSLDSGIENEAISTFSQVHPPQAAGPFTVAARKKDYRLRYVIRRLD